MATPWVHLPRLTVELPEEGWAVSESVLLTSPGGTDITAATSRPPDGADSLALAHRHLQMLIDTLPGFSESSLTETTAFAGAPAVARRFGFERDGGEWCGRVVYSIVDNVACTVSAAWPADGPQTEAADAAFDTAVRGVRMLARFTPLNELPPTSDEESTSSAGSAPLSRRPAVDASTWQRVRSAWLKPMPEVATPEPGTPSRWSEAELQVCATLLGAAMFPTVDPEPLLAHPESVRSAITGAVARSLLARGIIRADNGRPSLSEKAGAELELAVQPDLAVQVERFERSGNRLWWFGVRPDRAIEVSVEQDGTRSCAPMTPADLLRRILAGTGLGDGGAAAGDARTVQPEKVFDDKNEVRAVVRVRTTWRDGSASTGGWLQWAVDVEGGLYSVDEEVAPSGTRWRLQPSDVDQARALLLAHLPGNA